MKLKIFRAGGILIVVFIFVAVVRPNFLRSPRSPLNTIINNLRNIDAAKQLWAADHGITNPAHRVSDQDVQFYLKRLKVDPFSKPAVGEHYSVNPLYQPPEAVLTKNLRLHRGTVFETNYATGSTIRLATNGGWEVLLPASIQ